MILHMHKQEKIVGIISTLYFFIKIIKNTQTKHFFKLWASKFFLALAS
jgi:hypothetical protein